MTESSNMPGVVRLPIAPLHRRLRWWVTGALACLDAGPGGKAFCKRRRHHLGRHRTALGTVSWPKHSDDNG